MSNKNVHSYSKYTYLFWNIYIVGIVSIFIAMMTEWEVIHILVILDKYLHPISMFVFVQVHFEILQVKQSWNNEIPAKKIIIFACRIYYYY